MQTSQMSVEDVKKIILQFSKKDKLKLLKELEKEMLPVIFKTLPSRFTK